MVNETKKLQLTTPQAILVVGILITIAIFVTQKGIPSSGSSKTLSEQVRVSKDELTACLKDIDAQTLNTNIQTSVSRAMKAVPEGERGTPYSIVIGKDGVKTDIRGAESYEYIKAVTDGALIGKVATAYKGDIPLPESTDHIYGNPNAQVTIIEYSDYECPFCKRIHSTLKKVVDESNGNVNWIYRHWPLHQHSFEKLAASECVAQIKGNDAFWKYSDLLFGLLKTGDEPVTEQL